MTVDIDHMRRRIRKALGLEEDDVASLSNDDCDVFLNEAFWEI